MSATAILPNTLTAAPRPRPATVSKNGGHTISWETFQRQYLSREDEFKYEWVDGKVIKTKRAMDRTQLFILENLLAFFDSLKSLGKVSGRLIAEADLFFHGKHRRPDIVWLTTEQMYALADPEVNEVPAFVIEVVSTYDQAKALKLKMKNYSDAGVKVVWQIFPDLQQVDVYSGENLENMIVCTGEKICSAAPALPHFALPVSEIFKLK